MIRGMIQRLKDFKPEAIILKVIDARGKDVAQYVAEIQLYMEGTRGSDGAFIADYDSYLPITIRIKQEKGQPTDRVTLRDTGDFHKSFKTVVDNEKFEITATDWKTDKLMDRYGDGIMALSDEHLESIKKAILLPELKAQLKKALLNG